MFAIHVCVLLRSPACMYLIQRDGLFLDIVVEEQLKAPRLVKMLVFFNEEV